MVYIRFKTQTIHLSEALACANFRITTTRKRAIFLTALQQ